MGAMPEHCSARVKRHSALCSEMLENLASACLPKPEPVPTLRLMSEAAIPMHCTQGSTFKSGTTMPYHDNERNELDNVQLC